jgi:predicted Zn-dependent protease
MTIASTLLDVLKQVVTVGSDLQFFGGSIGSPTLLVGEMTVAGR